MRFVKPLLLLLFIGIFGTATKAQDLHFTQYYLSPLTLNPALAGNYEGTFRIGGVYRDQWGSALGNSFTTPSFYVDAPLFPLNKKYWVGAGVSFVNDQVGSVGYNNTTAGGTVSLNYMLSEKTVASVGVQLNSVQKKFDRTLLQMEDHWNSSTGNFDGLSNDANSENSNYMDLGAGAAVKTTFGEEDKFRLSLGVGAFHLNGPQDGFNNEVLPTRLVGHASLDIDINDKIELTPMFLYQALSGASEANLALMLGYHLTDDLTLQYGQGYRFGDATNAILGAQYKNLRLGVSYDINLSDFTTVSSNRGGFEIGVGYIANIYSDPKVKPVMFCPGF